MTTRPMSAYGSNSHRNARQGTNWGRAARTTAGFFLPGPGWLAHQNFST